MFCEKKSEFEGIDLIDQAILKHLLQDSRRTYQEIADDIKVSTGTVHGRVSRMKEQALLPAQKSPLTLINLAKCMCLYWS